MLPQPLASTRVARRPRVQIVTPFFNANLRTWNVYMQRARNPWVIPPVPATSHLCTATVQHSAEVERLKLELNRAQRSSSEHSERADKLKKQNEALESRVQELKKSSSAEQGELRELRTKLKAAEHERAQLAAKQGEAGETKKALQVAEARRKDDVRERDKRIVELEKVLAGEKKRRELVEGKLAEVKSRVDGEVSEARAATAQLEMQLESAKNEAHDARAALDDAKAAAEERQEELLEMLEQHKSTLTRVAQEYGQLASRSVSQATHAQTRYEADALRLRVNKLERKLANSEDQVVELAHLIRQTKDENVFLARQLREAQEEAARYSSLLQAAEDELRDEARVHPELEEEIEHFGVELQEAEHAKQEAIREDLHGWADLHGLRADSLTQHAAVLVAALEHAEEKAKQHASELSASKTKCDELQQTHDILRTQYVDTQEQLARTSTALDASKAAEATLAQQLADAAAEQGRLQQAIQREKDAGRRLANTVQQHRAAEDALREEMDQCVALAGRVVEEITDLLV